MRNDLLSALRRATAATRASDPMEATRLIQAALAGAAAPEAAPQPAPRGQRPRLDPDAEIVEPLAPPRPGRLRRPLREVLSTLRHGRGTVGLRPRPGPAVSAPAIPDGARFEARSHAAPAGTRGYRLYVPAPDGAPLRGLVLMLHGCTQTPEDFATGTGMNALAETHRLLVAYPAQTGADNASSCWNWFRPGDQRRGAGEPAILAGLATALTAEFAIDPACVFVAGLSAGGAMAAVLGATYPEVFSAIGVHSGLPAGSANDVLSAFAAMRGDPGLLRPAPGPDAPRTIVFHGTADATVHATNGERIAAAIGADAEETAGQAPGGRSYRRRVARAADGTPLTEHWAIDGAGHAWSGGHAPGSYTDPAGPDASAEMVRFFLEAPAPRR